jgi:hypothetical protein
MHSPDLTFATEYVSILSPLMRIGGRCCLSFMYYMYGDPLYMGKLMVWNKNRPLWVQHYSHQDKWYKAQVTMTNGLVGQLEFRAYRMTSRAASLLDIAIDQVAIVRGVCAEQHTGNDCA